MQGFSIPSNSASRKKSFLREEERLEKFRSPGYAERAKDAIDEARRDAISVIFADQQQVPMQ
jgi:hypothetical protein